MLEGWLHIEQRLEDGAIAYYEARGLTDGIGYPESFRQSAILYERAGKLDQATQG